jgi:hypothetical protein
MPKRRAEIDLAAITVFRQFIELVGKVNDFPDVTRGNIGKGAYELIRKAVWRQDVPADWIELAGDCGALIAMTLCPQRQAALTSRRQQQFDALIEWSCDMLRLAALLGRDVEHPVISAAIERNAQGLLVYLQENIDARSPLFA